MSRTLFKIALAGVIHLMLGFGVVAFAQPSSVSLVTVRGETMSDAALEALRGQVSDERDRLLVKLQANTPDQAAGSITTSTGELAGRMIAGAMRHGLVVQPHGKPVLLGIDGQALPDGKRQLVLLNLSAWIAHGRVLDASKTEAFAVLPDEEIRQNGAPFKVEGVNYLAKADGGALAFLRAP